ncbi:DUF3801 domain-containing protein, partial [Pseudoflavonifractor sp. 60]|uniref:DUF3801 domain-containing protein n=1 Tax=Pseudoflavonifractor sp. 60 TaxID=2304576 RepID=UPI0013686230
LIRKDQGAQQIDIAKSGIKDFERVLDKYGVDYAIRKDVSQVSAPVIKCKKTPRKKCKFVAERRKKR